MITFVTDVLPGEPDILEGVRYKELRILAIDDSPIKTVPAPKGGWTHEVLQNTGALLADETEEGANAYLGSEFVGSTEV